VIFTQGPVDITQKPDCVFRIGAEYFQNTGITVFQRLQRFFSELWLVRAATSTGRRDVRRKRSISRKAKDERLEMKVQFKSAVE
jgi:hypothetical protein